MTFSEKAIAMCGVLILITQNCSTAGQNTKNQNHSGSGVFNSPTMCINCHHSMGSDFQLSEHSISFTEEIFQSMYRGDYLRKRHAHPENFENEPACISCHAPMLFVQEKYSDHQRASGKDCGDCHMVPAELCWSDDWVTTLEEPIHSLATSGVSCDFCHTMTGKIGSTVGNANFVSTPGETKYGPLPPLWGRTWHHNWSSLHTSAEMCGICHEARNRFGVAVRTTYSEWLKSPQAQRSIICQDCHMSERGYLIDGRPFFKTGPGAVMNFVKVPTDRPLHTHQFPGGKEQEQIIGSVALAIDPVLRPGSDGMQVEVVIESDRAAHRLPAGGAGLHSIWLDLVVESKFWQVRGTADSNREGTDYSVLGKTKYDSNVYGGKFPNGARVYRSVFIKHGGSETLRHFEAAERVFDNRLFPGERRHETFSFTVPDSQEKTSVNLRLTAWLVRLPGGLAADLQIQQEEPVLIASTEAVGRLDYQVADTRNSYTPERERSR